MAYFYIILMAFLIGATMPLDVDAQSSNPLPPAKQAIEQGYEQERVAGALNPAPRNPNAQVLELPEEPFPTNALSDENCEAPLPSEFITVTNCWYGILDGINTMVFAGAETSDSADETITSNSQQGLVVIISGAPGVGRRAVLTPAQVGTVYIIGAQNGVLTITDGTGRYRFQVDVRAGLVTFSASNTIRGDLNGDGVVDLKDMQIIQGSLNASALVANDPRDLNRDGKIDILDARILTTLCTHSHCS